MTQQIRERADRYIARTYTRFPPVMERGSGCRLWDTEGRQYTDFVAGIAVCSLGHAHPAVTAALTEQAQRLLHVSNLYYTIPQTELAQRLVAESFADRVFFGNSGAEANEAAIKLARKYFKDAGAPDRYRVISMAQSFHGRTMATLSATGQEKVRKGFDPVLPGFSFVPFNDLPALEAAMSDDVAAVMVEPVQGEGGVVCPDAGYLKGVRELCDRHGALLIFDEIQTGMGRTGRLFAYQHSAVTPDIMTLAKALANGLPIGAMLARESVAEAFGAGAHASTFGGTPVVTAAALAVVDTLTGEGFLEGVRRRSAYFRQKLDWLVDRHETAVAVRGIGLLLGLELTEAGGPIVLRCLEKGFLINCVQDTILRFVPPLIVSEPEIDALVGVLDEELD